MTNNDESLKIWQSDLAEYAATLRNRLITMSDEDADWLPLCLVGERNQLLGRNERTSSVFVNKAEQVKCKQINAQSKFSNSMQPDLFTAEHYK
jgi:site-specific recombinase XerD